MDELERLAALMRRRNELDEQIAGIIGRPALTGHLGEFIAARIFDIDLVESVTHKSIDGYFRSGPLAGRSVDIKLYGQDTGILDVTKDAPPDTYLVMTGPRAGAGSSRGTTRPLVVDAVYLFDAVELGGRLRESGLKNIGVATSVRRALWQAAQVYPTANHGVYALSDEQRRLLAQFGSPTAPGG